MARSTCEFAIFPQKRSSKEQILSFNFLIETGIKRGSLVIEKSLSWPTGPIHRTPNQQKPRLVQVVPVFNSHHQKPIAHNSSQYCDFNPSRRFQSVPNRLPRWSGKAVEHHLPRSKVPSTRSMFLFSVIFLSSQSIQEPKEAPAKIQDVHTSNSNLFYGSALSILY